MSIFNETNRKKITLLFFDILILNLAYFLALYFRFDLNFSEIPQEYLLAFKKYTLINTIISIFIYSRFKMYKMILEYASYTELINITWASILSFISHITLMTSLVEKMPFSYYLFGFMIQYVLTVSSRFAKRMLIYMSYKQKKITKNTKRQ